MTPQEQIEFLGLDKLNVLDVLKLYITNFSITGSLSFFEYGVILRPIGDLDIVVDSFDDLLRLKNKFPKLEYTSDYDTIDGSQEVNSEVPPNRAHLYIDGVKVCIFKGEYSDSKECEYLMNRKFRVLHPKHSVPFLENYISKYESYGQWKLGVDDSILSESQFQRLKKYRENLAAYDKVFGDPKSTGFFENALMNW